jgi:hypothetical protein
LLGGVRVRHPCVLLAVVRVGLTIGEYRIEPGLFIRRRRAVIQING